MKRPTITKLQTINALVEIKRRDHIKFHEESSARLARAEKDMEDELKRVLKDPARIAIGTTIYDTLPDKTPPA